MAAKKKAVAKKVPVASKKATAKKAVAKKATAKKATAVRATASKATASKATASKATAKKAIAKKAPAAKAVAKKKATPSVNAAGVKKPPTKSEILTSIAESTELSRKQVISVFDALNALIQDNLKPRGPGSFSVPGLMKIRVNKKPATKARKGINPFTGQEATFKAKPARKVVKVTPLKNLKDMV
ncbi:HU family DNA-binding protein [Granulosicoccus antarcticus]|uniref:Viral histone-like protein n=1 Tax=Granulosicoccus antarcticus IMCC3135 TaxID=1192854 RepID=A0A2Z2NRB2_9GAMM|nr:HU family DNA-binding protein [Granulosicoccus antarcticus]ASJ71280.1 DNA-binding protein HRL53 [Granulosicoccus antarcticus IMCC3135]